MVWQFGLPRNGGSGCSSELARVCRKKNHNDAGVAKSDGGIKEMIENERNLYARKRYAYWMVRVSNEVFRIVNGVDINSKDSMQMALMMLNEEILQIYGVH